LSLQYYSHAVSRRYSRDLGTTFDNMTPEPKSEYLVSASATKQTMISNKVIVASYARGTLYDGGTGPTINSFLVPRLRHGTIVDKDILHC